MKQTFFLFATAMVLVACTGANDKAATASGADSTLVAAQRVVAGTATVDADSLAAEDENMTAWVVIADTGTAYAPLRDRMLELQAALGNSIDTMGRTWNEEKQLIALPENDEDEVYAGDYLPRRTPDETLSLEHLGMYQPDASTKTLALVTGIYDDPRTADSALRVLRGRQPGAFVLKSEVFIGCIH